MSGKNNNKTLKVRSPGFSDFTKWVKETVLKKHISKSISNSDSIDSNPIKRSSPSSKKVTPLKGSVSSGKKRKSQKSNRRSKNSITDKSSKNQVINNPDYNDDYNDEISWVDDEILNKDELIIPNINSLFFKMKSSSIYSVSRSIQQPSPDDFLENTNIIKGSVEHFAYVRTLRKLRKDRNRPTRQALLLNNILESFSLNSQMPDELHKELIHYQTRVHELNKIKRNNSKKSIDKNISSSSYNINNNSTSSLYPSSLNKRLSAILAEIHPSPITMKYRPSYASSKTVTIFDENLNRFIEKELPMARRKRRLSELSTNTLVRSTSSSSTSTNSSQSSLVTLTDDVEQQKYSSLITKNSSTFLPNIVNSDVDEEDDVPLFVLKEQFKFSGRSCTFLKNNVSSVEENRISLC